MTRTPPPPRPAAVEAPNLFVGAGFVLSAADARQLPTDNAPEVAFAGRSNAGKSSALNALCGTKSLARVSKTPGRTQLLNVFELPNPALGGGRLVDLPGYGFAQVPEAMRARWRALVGGYVRDRRNLRGVVVVMDSRHPLTEIDQQMLDWAFAHDRKVHVLLTKADKLSFGAGRQTLLKIRQALGDQASVQLFSAHARTGLEEARAAVQALLLDAGFVAEAAPNPWQPQ